MSGLAKRVRNIIAASGVEKTCSCIQPYGALHRSAYATYRRVPRLRRKAPNGEHGNEHLAFVRFDEDSFIFGNFVFGIERRCFRAAACGLERFGDATACGTINFSDPASSDAATGCSPADPAPRGPDDWATFAAVNIFS